MKRYKLKTWCNDCLGEDDQGCFEGSTEVEESDNLKELKERADRIERNCSQWECEIIDSRDNSKVEF